MSDIAENWSHVLNEPSSATSLCILGKYALLPSPVKFGKKGRRCVLSSLKKRSYKPTLQEHVSGFSLTGRGMKDGFLFPHIAYWLDLRCSSSTCCLLWIPPEHLNFPSALCKGSNPGSCQLAIIALLIRSLVKSFTWLRPVRFMTLRKSTQRIKSLCFISVSSGYPFFVSMARQDSPL